MSNNKIDIDPATIARHEAHYKRVAGIKLPDISDRLECVVEELKRTSNGKGGTNKNSPAMREHVRSKAQVRTKAQIEEMLASVYEDANAVSKMLVSVNKK